VIIIGYLRAIKDIPIGIAYSVATSLSISGVALAGSLIYGDVLRLQSLVGIGVVMFGVLLLVTS
jgi:multidrug transporter EmrE-like cation transporter